jgi:hypothetical protein
MQKLAIALALLSSALCAGCDSSDPKTDDGKAAKKPADAKAADAKSDDGKAEADAKAAEPVKAVKLAELSLEEAGADVKLQAPEGAKAAEEFGAYTVKAGETFQLEIRAGAADLAARKKEIEENTVNKLKSFVTESDTALVYETEVMGKPEFHFVANVEAEDAKYNCEDTKGKAYTKADIEAMHTACTSLQAVE